MKRRFAVWATYYSDKDGRTAHIVEIKAESSPCGSVMGSVVEMRAMWKLLGRILDAAEEGINMHGSVER